jgi:hypothetical protein
MTIIRKLEHQRGGLMRSLSLQRANVIRYVAGHPGRTSAEVAAGVGMSSQNCGQVLHKARELVKRDGRWYLRGSK